MNQNAMNQLNQQYASGQGMASGPTRAQSHETESEQTQSRTASISTLNAESPRNTRSLPSRTVTDHTFDDAYSGFILYCNPTIPLDTDTTELKKIFRAPPKSDGKNFSTFTLFELIRKLESKEIKTWAQLALDLGVEAPDLEKGQSAQKVQQFAVRLKVSSKIYQVTRNFSLFLQEYSDI